MSRLSLPKYTNDGFLLGCKTTDFATFHELFNLASFVTVRHSRGDTGCWWSVPEMSLKSLSRWML